MMDMSQQISTKEKNTWTRLDPRTKLILLITLPTFLLGNAGGTEMLPYKIIFSLLPFILMLISGNKQKAIFYFLIISLVQVLWTFASSNLHGSLYIVLYIIYGIVMGVFPCMILGVYVLTTTTVSEFITGMERLHFPTFITIPLSVMFRFFPTVQKEASSVNRAMTMRGIRIGKYSLMKNIEYRLIPTLICTLQIGDELSAAALTRGLGAPVKRTSICSIGFKLSDILLLTLCGSAFLVWFLGIVGVNL